MRLLLLTIIGLGLATPAAQAAKLKGARYPEGSVQCVTIGSRTSEKLYTGNMLSGVSKPFGTLDTFFRYHATVRGKYHYVKRGNVDPTKKLRFEGIIPDRWAVEGRTVGKVSTHPKGKGRIVSETHVILRSQKSGVQFSVGLPWSASVSPTHTDTTANIDDTGRSAHGTTVRSFVAKHGSALNGAAGDSTDVFDIGLSSAIRAGQGSAPYPSDEVHWQVQRVYSSLANHTLPHLGPCSPDLNFG